MFLKKLVCIVLMLTSLLQPFAARAVDMESAFSNLLGSGTAYTTNAPGRYQSGARSGFSGGGMELRVPRTNNVPQLFSVTPPSIQAGCNGISAHFGGFSFISGKEFETLLKSIASGAALGFVTSLVMKTLCPPCEAVVQELKTAAQMAARLARDSCEIGRKAGADFMAGLGASGDTVSLCASTDAAANGSGDSLLSYSGLCSSLTKAADKLHEFNTKANAATDPIEKAKLENVAECATGEGNQTWTSLSAFDGSGNTESDAEANYRRKLVLINIMGAKMHVSKSDVEVSCQLGNGEKKVASNDLSDFYCPPPVDTMADAKNNKLLGFFMCGTPASLAALSADKSVSSSVMSYCQGFFPTATTDATNQVWHCAGDDGGSGTKAQARTKCLTLALDAPDKVFTGTGFVILVNDLLREGVRRVRDNQGFSDDKGKKIVALIQTAPYPLYQAINAAAVYPSAAEDLMDSMSILVAEQFAYALLDETIRVKGRSSSAVCLQPAQASELLSFIEKLRAANNARRSEMAQNLTMQQALTEQIRQINLAVQRQVLNSELMHTGKVADAFNKAVSKTIKSDTPTP